MASTPIPVFDAARLNRQTRGNTPLQLEMLALFVNEVERLLRQVEDAPDPQVRGERLRALIGVARNMGATLIAQEARTLETQIATESPDLAMLREAIADTVAYLRQNGL